MSDADAVSKSRRMDSAGPPIQPGTEPYWEAAAEGRLVLMRCNGCGRAFFYPRRLCPFCASLDTKWIESTGRGRIYSYTIVRRGLPEPQATAYVTLEEGPTLLTALDETDLDSIKIDQPVRARFRPGSNGRPLLVFTRE